MNNAIPLSGPVGGFQSVLSFSRSLLPAARVSLGGLAVLLLSPVAQAQVGAGLLEIQIPLPWVLVLLLAATGFAAAWLAARVRERATREAGAVQVTDLQVENAKLFRQVQSRLHELMARDKLLDEARLAAEQVREDHCDFLSITSHRMRKPLETLVSTMNLLARATNGEVRQLAEAAIGQCRQLRSCIEELQRSGQQAVPGTASASIPEPSLREMAILLVENDTHTSLCPRLEARGHKVRRETNGVDGADAALRGKFDLVLIDVRLPLIDGVETARKIRGDFGNSELLIVGLVTDIRAGDKERYVQRGLSGVLPLPASDAQLSQILSWAEQKTRQGSVAVTPGRTAKMLNPSTLERQRDTLGHLAFAELLGDRVANLPKKITAFTSALTGRHWLDAQQQAQAIAAQAESVGLEVVANRLKALSARLSIDSERDYCRHQRTEILALMRTSIQQLKSWREKNVHTEWALR